ncbi:hypothetical protein GOODEAATRI_017370 [Goodea atripinnis]|uniref:Sterile alpha motif domain-containing protein 9-like n=1 Tax=Goodea atripinnis TaxID=208336 RepID=A0ABV0NB83_9TELE
MSTDSKLFSMLALLNAYVPDSYLIMEECQQVLGPPDPIHGGPPFTSRMDTFFKLIRVSNQRVHLIHPIIAKRSVELLADLNILRSSIAEDCMFQLCGEQAQLHTVQFVRDLLTKREMGEKGKEKFSLLIKDIIEKEKFVQALLVLKKASDKFQDKHIFPQTVARLYYIGGTNPNFKKAEEWAKEAIDTAPNNSYAADTLGQVYKNRFFPALLDCLNHGLFVSKEKRAFKFEVTEKTQSDLEQIRDELKTIYEENVEDVKVAERYILSNIILSNKVCHSPKHPSVRELQSILQRFMATREHNRDPEFYLLVLLLFWPEEKLQTSQENDNEELKEPDTDEDQLQDQTLEEADINEEDTGEESEQPSPGLIFDPDLERYVNLMEKAYDNVYSKYLRGRYLLPLFFLGKGSGLSRWIHKSRLDAVVERTVDTELGNDLSDPNSNKTKRRTINDKWNSGEVWQMPEIQKMLQPVQIENFTVQQSGKEAEVVFCVGGKQKSARECQCGRSAESSMRFYLGFNIRGPVVFEVETP